MPQIKTNNGIIRYSTIPLYEGIKLIDKPKAEANLHIFMQVMRKHGLHIQLAFGSLLGAIRDNDFITHDEDIDINILEEEREVFFDSLHDLYAAGFTIARYDRRGLISVIREGEYIDIYIFSKLNDDFRQCSGMIIPATFLEDLKPYTFKDEEFLIPQNEIDYLVFEYGEDWQQPAVWQNFQISKTNKLLFATKEKIKGILPDYIYFKICNKAEKRMNKRYLQNWEKYQQYKKKK